MDPKGSGVAWPSQLLSSDLLGHQWRPGSRDRSGTPLSDGLCPGLPVPQLGITYQSFWFLWSVFFFFFLLTGHFGVRLAAPLSALVEDFVIGKAGVYQFPTGMYLAMASLLEGRGQNGSAAT